MSQFASVKKNRLRAFWALGARAIQGWMAAPMRIMRALTVAVTVIRPRIVESDQASRHSSMATICEAPA
jgi:hypothetical protein